MLTGATVADLFECTEKYVAGWSRVEVEGQTRSAHDGSNTLWYARAILLVERDEALLHAGNNGVQAGVDAMTGPTGSFSSSRRPSVARRRSGA